eukprot:TRINITY_DN5612_c0_g1_i1.p1 TRINITY_DN5612_c0_g1~~TRINITY_DN5612_c0_g1_i1.p1  ORF type:complete len:112 (+),score=2.73 TRINITY_DN5612_c0_g1_i1:38-373(+)
MPINTEVVFDATVNLHKRLHNITFKKRAPRAVSEIKKFVKTAMHAEDIRIDVGLNQMIWSQGIRNPPKRMRLRMERKRNEDEDAAQEMYVVVSHVDVPTFKGLTNQKVEEQ